MPSRSVAIGPITQKPVAPKATYVGIYYQKIDSQAAKATAFSGDIRDMSNESTMNVMNTTNNSAGSAGGGSSVPIVFTLDTDEEYLGIYEYDDFDGDKESGTTFRWLRSSSLTGSYAAIPGATGLTYKPTSSDVGKYIKFEVTPKTTVFPTAGAATSSDAIQAKIVEYKIGYLARMKMLNDLSEDTICRILTSSGKWENYTLSHRVEIDGKFRSIDSMELDELVSYLPVGTFVDEDDIIRCYEMVQYTISSEGLISRINFISNTGAQNITLNANTYNTKNKKFEPSGVCISMYTPIYFIDLDNKYNVIDDDILLMKPSDLKSGTAYSGKAYFTDSITHFAGGVVLDK